MKKILLTAIVILLTANTVVFAQSTVTGGASSQTGGKASTVIGNSGNGGPIPVLSNPLKFKTLEGLISGLVKIALQLGSMIAVLALVWVGFLFIVAQGNDSKITAAKNALWWVIIGIAILFGAQLIMEIIKGTLSGFIDPSSWLKSNG